MKASILNLAPLREQGNYKKAMEDMFDLAEEADRLGYERFWIAEHHNTKNFASSATVILMDETLRRTQHIRVGSGGIMLPNHSPYIVAEQFGTLATLYPDRVDLGLGRAPGTDMKTAKAIRRTNEAVRAFPKEVQEIEGYFEDSNEVQAFPAAGIDVPIVILGSSTDSAHLAAKLGLPYAFASHFAPGMLLEAVKIYRDEFKPSKHLNKPYVIVGINAFVADTYEEAESLRTTQLQSSIDIVTGNPRPLQPPVKNEAAVWDNYAQSRIDAVKIPHFGPVKFDKEKIIGRVKEAAKNMSALSLVGTKEMIMDQIGQLQDQLEFEELMVTGFIYDNEAMKKSYRLFKEAVDQIK